jgi:UDP-N-acetylmuramoyl-L-alanyl-D-glutamate--2,6-diaminopimelate ligase
MQPISLESLLKNIPTINIIGRLSTLIGQIHQDSRQVKPSDVFVAMRGTQTDGHQYIEQVIQQGVSAIVCEEIPTQALLSIATHPLTIIQVKDTAQTLALMACNYYDNPSKKLKLVGITGTNGKTTTVTMLYRLFKALGYKTGLLSTVQNHIDNEVLPATHTTPDALTLNKLLSKMVEKGCQFVFMEVSSHALVQHRVTGIDFAVAIFSNITHDHLDYHGSFDNYIKAKKILFDNLSPQAFALLNKDDKKATIMVQNSVAKKYSYALKSGADFKAKILANNIQGLHLNIDNHEVAFQLIGEFNAYNLLAIYGTAVLLGENKEDILRELSALSAAVGRFELIRTTNPKAKQVTAIVDYAHTPDALKNVLETIQNLRQGHEKIITVVGCGGNRDATKRPLMAAIACKYSDFVILTSDNPRFEKPENILIDMEKGVSLVDKPKVTTLIDRKNAIEKAYYTAQQGDIILIAGKGHETYQEIEGIKYDFDDMKIIKQILS